MKTAQLTCLPKRSVALSVPLVERLGIIAGAAAILATLACGPLASDGGDTGPDLGASPADPTSATDSTIASLQGVVTDVDGQPVAGAVVSSGSRRAIADTMGRFEIFSVPLSERRLATVSASKAGFVSTVRVVFANPSSLTTLALALKRTGTVTAVDSAVGGTVVSSDRRGILSIPPNAIVDARGESVSGAVDVHFTVFDPATQDLKAYPGTFYGRRSSGTWGVVGSVALAVVAIRRGDDRFGIRPGASATLEVAVNPALASNLRSLPTWRYNAGGFWDEAGTSRSMASTREGNQMVYETEIRETGAVGFHTFFDGATGLTCDNIRVTDNTGRALDKIDVKYTVVGDGVTELASRAESGQAALLALIQGGQVRVAGQEWRNGLLYKGELSFVAGAASLGWSAMFVDQTGVPIPVGRTDAACTTDESKVLVLNPEPSSACNGRRGSNGICVEF